MGADFGVKAVEALDQLTLTTVLLLHPHTLSWAVKTRRGRVNRRSVLLSCLLDSIERTFDRQAQDWIFLFRLMISILLS